MPDRPEDANLPSGLVLSFAFEELEVVALPQLAQQIQRRLRRRTRPESGIAPAPGFWDRCWSHAWVRASLFTVVFITTWILSGGVAGD